MNNTPETTEATTDDDISAGLTFMYNLGLDHAIEAVKKLITDQAQAVVLINALEKLKQ